MSLPCALCATPLTAESTICPGCRALVTVLVFPALSRHPQSVAALPVSEGDASCFYHSHNKAVVPCDRCGRFLCGLCQIDWIGKNWCPNCVQQRRDLITRAVLYDSLALHLAVFPLLVWPVTLVTGPVALYLTIRHWRSPGSLVRQTNVRLYVAAALASIEIAGWIWLFAFGVARYL